MRKIKVKTKLSKKLPWVDMQITRVHLNPEQAVLSCCNASSRGFQSGPYQCAYSPLNCQGGSDGLSS